MTNSEIFFKNGLFFSCQRCSNCCRLEPGFVYLSQNDLTKLLDWFSLEKDAFIADYCRWTPYYDGSEVLALKEKKNYDCIFWNNGCTVYPVRPLQCTTFPFWDYIIHDANTWNECSKDCPGINKNTFHSPDEIAEKAFLTRRNIPIKREHN